MNNKEIFEHWEKEDGLITVKLASKIIGIGQASVSRATDAGKIKSYSIDKTRFLSFKDVVLYKAKRDDNK